MAKVSDFQYIRLKLASPEEILEWSHGEVTKPETINYRTQKPEKDGLFCERIFGPEKDWECYCGKYRRIRYKGIVCEKCGVEVTRSIVRRERMGHIKLASSVSHIWFLRGVPSKIGLVLDMSVQELERVIYFASYIITKIDESARQTALKEIVREYKLKFKEAKSKAQKEKLRKNREKVEGTLKSLKKLQLFSEADYHTLSLKYGGVFEAGIGGEAIRKALEEVDFKKLLAELEEEMKKASSLNRHKILKRRHLVKAMMRAGIRPEWMCLTVLPVIPPDLRPMVQLDGGRYATSDLNDLYRRVINRNNRLKRLIELNAPEVIRRNEKRMLQEAVDALIDNSARRGQTVVAASTGQRRPLKSLADMLKGKQGRFRQNLLGKRVDYSGRSVIVIGPELELSQCGLPKKMALELFKPFVIRRLLEKELVHNVRGAGKLIEAGGDEVWDSLEEVISGRFVLLNRAPTLHRLGIQAFRPVLIEGSAIQIHPMVCRAFNADFDGDQMAVHLPLTHKSQEEAEEIMLATRNLLKPSSGEPIVIPTKDIVLGCHWASTLEEGTKGEGKIFGTREEAILACQFGELDLRAKIKLRLQKISQKQKMEKGNFIETSVGRILISQVLPNDFPFLNRQLTQKILGKLIGELIERYPNEKVVAILDEIKKMGFEFATRSGISWGRDDLVIPPEKTKIVREAEKEVALINKQHREGFLTDQERLDRVIEVWTIATGRISERVPQALNPYGSVYTIISSGARGSWGQTTQMAGIKGLVINPSDEIIELPIKNCFKEGFNVLEYFISTHGARKGTSDTALKTAAAGYLTRRLIDVAQDIVVREEDCGNNEGVVVYREDGEEIGISFVSRIIGRVSLESIRGSSSKTPVVKKGDLIDELVAQKLDKAGLRALRVRSVINCRTHHGVCRKCYGYSMTNNRLVNLGEAVGIITAQAIGEPGTQLTMRTFHTGGVARGGDITQGLPRVEEIFEARNPKTEALVSEIDGKVIGVEDKEKFRVVKIKPDRISTEGKTRKKTNKIVEYKVPLSVASWVEKGDLITEGQQLSEGHINLKQLLKIAGREAVQRYIIKEVQNIYTSQGEGINDKHIEIIIRQMFSRSRIKDPGDSRFLADEIIENSNLSMENERIKKIGKKLATALPLLLGITKVSLSTESFLSAASFQETARVLINAAIEGKEDRLRGLKENVIIGKLIPAGTGFKE